MTNKINFQLPIKQCAFLLDAVRFRIKVYELNLKSGELSEDEIAEIKNDLPLFESIEKYFEEKIKNFNKQFE